MKLIVIPKEVGSFLRLKKYLSVVTEIHDFQINSKFDRRKHEKKRELNEKLFDKTEKVIYEE